MGAYLTNDEWNARMLDWPLTPESVVVEVGGYEGKWAREIACLYNPVLYVFEPQQWAFRRALQNFRRLKLTRPRLFNYGLGDRDLDCAHMGGWHTDGASFLKVAGEGDGTGRLRRADTVLSDLGLVEIDLLVMNVEGYEYILLPHLLETGWLPKIIHLAVQFHGGDAAPLRMQIGETHRLLWSGAWDAWERN